MLPPGWDAEADASACYPLEVTKSPRIAQNLDVDDFELSDAEMATIEAMDTGRDLILDIATADEAARLHGITFEQ